MGQDEQIMAVWITGPRLFLINRLDFQKSPTILHTIFMFSLLFVLMTISFPFSEIAGLFGLLCNVVY
jgi:hypothetical protein